MNRRGFLGSILALGAAPAIVRADSLMRIVPIQTTVWQVVGVREDLSDVLGIPGVRLMPLSKIADASKYILVAESGGQVFRKTIAVTGTWDMADRQLEVAYQIQKRGKEMKRDIEWARRGA